MNVNNTLVWVESPNVPNEEYAFLLVNDVLMTVVHNKEKWKLTAYVGFAYSAIELSPETDKDIQALDLLFSLLKSKYREAKQIIKAMEECDKVLCQYGRSGQGEVNRE